MLIDVGLWFCLFELAAIHLLPLCFMYMMRWTTPWSTFLEISFQVFFWGELDEAKEMKSWPNPKLFFLLGFVLPGLLISLFDNGLSKVNIQVLAFGCSSIAADLVCQNEDHWLTWFGSRVESLASLIDTGSFCWLSYSPAPLYSFFMYL